MVPPQERHSHDSESRNSATRRTADAALRKCPHRDGYRMWASKCEVTHRAPLESGSAIGAHDISVIDSAGVDSLALPATFSHPFALAATGCHTRSGLTSGTLPSFSCDLMARGEVPMTSDDVILPFNPTSVRGVSLGQRLGGPATLRDSAPIPEAGKNIRADQHEEKNRSP
jgi:hypothetical protein